MGKWTTIIHKDQQYNYEKLHFITSVYIAIVYIEIKLTPAYKHLSISIDSSTHKARQQKATDNDLINTIACVCEKQPCPD